MTNYWDRCIIVKEVQKPLAKGNDMDTQNRFRYMREVVEEQVDHLEVPVIPIVWAWTDKIQIPISREVRVTSPLNEWWHGIPDADSDQVQHGRNSLPASDRN